MGVDLSKFHKADLSSEEIAEAVSLLEGAGVLDAVRAKSEKLISDAKNGLSVIPDSEYKTMMMELVDFFIARDY